MTSIADDERISRHIMLKWRERPFVVLGMGLKVFALGEKKDFVPRLTDICRKKEKRRKLLHEKREKKKEKRRKRKEKKNRKKDGMKENEWQREKNEKVKEQIW